MILTIYVGRSEVWILKAIMYHYVRPPQADLPYFRYLNRDDFSRQLDQLEADYTVVSLEKFLKALETGDALSDGIVLTFDDGLKDHYEFVLPELERRGLWGFFYIPTGIYEHRCLLDVHKVHFLLGRLGGSAMLAELRRVLSNHDILEPRSSVLGEMAYVDQVQDDSTAVKSILNYNLDSENRSLILSELMHATCDEASVFEHFYMTERDVCDLQTRGMVVGSHSVTHRVLSEISRSEQETEILSSFDFLEKLTGGLRVRSFCYPFGHPETFNTDTVALLNTAECKFSFQVANEEISARYLLENPQMLPRFDCNRFPHGHTSVG